MTGFIKMHRELLSKPIFANPLILKVWIWCLFKATHEPIVQVVGKQKVQLEPGQFVFGRFKAGEELDMAPTTVRDYMKWLVDNGSIDIKSANKFSLVTVVNWRVYQCDDEESPPSNPPTTRHQSATNKLSYTPLVSLSLKEYENLCNQYGITSVDRMIEILDGYKAAKGKKYKSDYGAIKKWVVNAWKDEQAAAARKGGNRLDAIQRMMEGMADG